MLFEKILVPLSLKFGSYYIYFYKILDFCQKKKRFLTFKQIVCIECMHKHKIFQLINFNLYLKLSVSEAQVNSSEQNQQQNNIIPGY